MTLVDRRLPVQARTVLLASAALIAIGWALYAAWEWNRTLAGLGISDRLVNALFQSVTARTAGFNTVELSYKIREILDTANIALATYHRPGLLGQIEVVLVQGVLRSGFAAHHTAAAEIAAGSFRALPAEAQEHYLAGVDALDHIDYLLAHNEYRRAAELAPESSVAVSRNR